MQLSPFWRCNILQKWFATFANLGLQKTDTLIKDFKDQNFSSVNIEVLVGDNDKEVAGLTAVYGQEVSIKITATATGEELDMFPVIITGDQRDKDYTFGGKYTTLCKAGSNGT